MGSTDIYNWAAARKAMIRAHQFASKKSSSNVLEDESKSKEAAEGEGKTVGGHDVSSLTRKRDEVHNVILSSISSSAQASGADPHHSHPIITMMADYDWSGGVAKAGMSWGAVGHAVVHAKENDGGKHHARLKRSQTVDF
jgi:hypothetical protein